MKQEFVISGMTCGNCKKGVEEKLIAIPEVSGVEVDLKSGLTKIETTKTFIHSAVESVLGSKYSVLDTVEKVSKLNELFPLGLIFLYVILGAAFLQHSNFQLRGFMIDFMGLFFIVFSFFKFLGYRSFPGSFATYDPIAKSIPFYGWIYPFLETVLGLAFLFRFRIDLALWVSLFVLSVTTFGVIRSLKNKNEIKCACLGTVLNLPMTEATLIENVVMIFMAFGLIFGAAY
jgi:copper chaperone CopZ